MSATHLVTALQDARISANDPKLSRDAQQYWQGYADALADVRDGDYNQEETS